MEKAIPKWCALFYVLFVIVDGATLPKSLIHSRRAFDKLEDDASFWSHFDKPSSANFEDDGLHARVKALDADKNFDVTCVVEGKLCQNNEECARICETKGRGLCSNNVCIRDENVPPSRDMKKKSRISGLSRWSYP
ncbi:uncharacterized protein LOC124434714 [Xenia sp. Carnegie-2017]|uniref:uncharacterized protein LOC124434714 n=1 Tax=Xenia sp. Carnegie-2017 TaxID=2897299 RepID=UPI001F04C182|nr:uncharacterized protein LOC124434714 [Xenia sp. Carnegie-2017]